MNQLLTRTRRAMRYRRLGRSGLKVSEIGFGTWGLGGSAGSVPAYGATDDRESLAALARACELGINFFDSADLYGDGHSETLLGRAFAGARAAVVLATKAGLSADGKQQDFAPSHLERSLQGSLRRLGTDFIDLFLLHNPPVALVTGDPGLWSFLLGLKERGLARAIGVSTACPEDGLAFACRDEVDVLQVNYNLLDQRARVCGLLDLCARRKIGVIARTPLCFGFLSGLLGVGHFDDDDHRARWSAAQHTRWHAGCELFRQCRGASDTDAQFALRFSLSHEAISTAIPGMMRVAEVEENAAAGGSGPLDRHARRAIEDLYALQSFFLGKEPIPKGVGARCRNGPQGASHNEPRPLLG